MSKKGASGAFYFSVTASGQATALTKLLLLCEARVEEKFCNTVASDTLLLLCPRLVIMVLNALCKSLMALFEDVLVLLDEELN